MVVGTIVGRLVGVKAVGVKAMGADGEQPDNDKNKTTSRAENFPHTSFSSVFGHPHSYSISIFIFTPS